jgi:hypothetical protein
MTDQTNKTHPSLIRRPFADGDYDFALPWILLEELEGKSQLPLYVALDRMVQLKSAEVAIVRETIRLGLIGGGLAPPEALNLIKKYVEDRPVMENFELTLEILEAGLFGSPAYRESPEHKAVMANQARAVAAVQKAMASVT